MVKLKWVKSVLEFRNQITLNWSGNKFIFNNKYGHKYDIGDDTAEDAARYTDDGDEDIPTSVLVAVMMILLLVHQQIHFSGQLYLSAATTGTDCNHNVKVGKTRSNVTKILITKK